MGAKAGATKARPELPVCGAGVVDLGPGVRKLEAPATSAVGAGASWRGPPPRCPS